MLLRLVGSSTLQQIMVDFFEIQQLIAPCKLSQIFIFNSYEMILQYCLSIHAINFFTFPSFTNFKVRLINQQNGDCNDSNMLDAKSLNSTVFPVQIKLKGGERLLMKIKIIVFKAKESEIVIGEGVVNINKNSIDNSIRVPIYDKKQGIQQVAICSVDFYVSGNPLDRNASIALDKSKSKIDDWRDHTEDAAYSQMSFTVQSENQRIQVEVPLDSQLNQRKPNNKQTSPQNKHSPTQLATKRLNNPKKVQYPLQPSSPLQNSAYLSQTPNKMQKPKSNKGSSEQKRQTQKSPTKVAQQVKKEDKNPSNEGKRIVFESNPISQSVYEDDKSIDTQQLRKKLKEQQKITKQLKKYLAKHKQREKNYSTEFKVQKKKVRRTQLKVQEISSYKSQGNYLKYFFPAQANKRLVLTNVKAYQLTQSQLKDDKGDQKTQIPINDFRLNFSSDQKIATFDSLGYRAYCIANYLKQYPMEIIIPEIEQGIKVKVQLNNLGLFQGVIGVQEGEKMAVVLKPKQKNKNNVLKNDTYKLCFDIKRYVGQKTLKESLANERNDISFRQMQQWSSPKNDIRSRIQSINVQPWGYGYSYLNAGASNQTDTLLNIKEKRKAIQSEVKLKNQEKLGSTPFKKDQKKGQIQNFKNNAKKRESEKNNFESQNSQKDQQIKKTQIMSNQSSQKEKKRVVKSEQKEKQMSFSDGIKVKKKEINQIKSIRNGNRNNYKFTHQKQQKKESIKQMWQKLLIKKKVQQEEMLEKKRVKSKEGKSPYRPYKKNSRQFETSLEDSDESPTSSKLYSMASGGSRLTTVNKAEKAHQLLTPLRTITLEVNNISITQPLAIVSEQLGEMSGKFIKLEIKDKITYYTQIIFNGEFNSILWKLSGCVFNQLAGNQILEIQIYKTIQNKISMLGKASIRVSKLYFLRNNHIYNGKIIYKKILNGEFTLGFQAAQNLPFQIIEEENEESQFNKQNSNRQSVQVRQTENFRNSKRLKNVNRKLERSSFSSGINGKDEKSSGESLIFPNNDRLHLKDTLKRNYNADKKRSKLPNNSLSVEAISELQQSNYMPEGLNVRSKT